MEQFLALIQKLDTTTSTNEKINAIASYFSQANPADAVWALFFLSGHRFKRLLSVQKLRLWCQEEANIPDWLFVESYGLVGDTAELISLLIHEQIQLPLAHSLHQWIEDFILPLRTMFEAEQRKRVVEAWKTHSTFERFIMNKILTGAFRIGVSGLLTLKGLSKAYSIPTSTLSLRLAGEWQPTAAFFRDVTAQDSDESDLLQKKSLNPYPFFLASPIEGELAQLGDPHEWLAEWKWDGIRAQFISQGGKTAIWSRGKELITPMFPELFDEALLTESFVLDGEILAYHHDRPASFADLQKRLGRKNVSAAIQKKYPVAFIIYDLIEWNGQDLRKLSFVERRQQIEEKRAFFLSHPLWRISPVIPFDTWEDVVKLREQAEKNFTEGLILKRKDSPYGIGRRRGFWWKYKIDSMTVDAVLLYAQPGSGYRSGLYTDYTFAVWHGKELVPIAKAYSGLTQEKIKEVDKWIRRNTVEKFGPVRRVKPELVFELAFENIQISKRHKSGLAVRFPRIHRWRHDKTAEMADNLDYLRALLKERSL